MGTFSSQKLLSGDPSLIPSIASSIESAFTAEGYEVQNQSLISGASEISITKGGIFKAVLGMKTALKVTLKPQGNGIFFDAGVGIFGQQAIPTVISMLFFWPVLLTQIWGLIQQSKLDDKALAIAESIIRGNGQPSSAASFSAGRKFCIHCGKEVPAEAAFCPHCGKQQ